MKLNDIKVYGVNGFGLMVNFSSIDLTLKSILTFIIIGYTLHKWYLMYHNNTKKK
jgi:hypothetical protein